MSWHYSQALEAAFWGGNSSDGEPSAPSKSMNTLATCCAPAKTMAVSNRSRFGMMLRPSTGDLGLDSWMSSLADSRARTSPSEAQPKPALMENAADSGITCSESLVRWDRATCSWKTPQLSLLEGLDVFSATWPRWGMMRAGECWALSMPAHLTNGSESGLLPTPTKSWGRKGIGLSNNLDNLRMSLESTELALRIVKICGWRWPARFIEWMMGWPENWSALRPLETDKFRQWLRSRGTPWRMNEGANDQAERQEERRQ